MKQGEMMANKKPLWHKAKRTIHFPWEIGETVCGKADQYFIKNEWYGVKCKECLCKIKPKKRKDAAEREAVSKQKMMSHRRERQT